MYMKPKEVEKSDFRQYGQMDKQGRQQSAKRKSQERRKQKRKSQKKNPAARKGRKVAVIVEGFVAPAGRKLGSLKRRVRSHLVGWKIKNYTPLWGEADLEVKRLKARHCQSTSGSWDEPAVARSTCPSQNVQNTSVSEHFWTFGSLDVEEVHSAVAQSTCPSPKHLSYGALLEVAKMHTVVVWTTCPSQNSKSTTCSDRFSSPGVVLCGRRNGSCSWWKLSQMCGSSSNFQNDHKRGTVEEDL